LELNSQQFDETISGFSNEFIKNRLSTRGAIATQEQPKTSYCCRTGKTAITTTTTKAIQMYHYGGMVCTLEWKS
jgi:hypothetical protein